MVLIQYRRSSSLLTSESLSTLVSSFLRGTGSAKIERIHGWFDYQRLTCVLSVLFGFWLSGDTNAQTKNCDAAFMNGVFNEESYRNSSDIKDLAKGFYCSDEAHSSNRFNNRSFDLGFLIHGNKLNFGDSGASARGNEYRRNICNDNDRAISVQRLREKASRVIDSTAYDTWIECLKITSPGLSCSATLESNNIVSVQWRFNPPTGGSEPLKIIKFLEINARCDGKAEHENKAMLNQLSDAMHCSIPKPTEEFTVTIRTNYGPCKAKVEASSASSTVNPRDASSCKRYQDSQACSRVAEILETKCWRKLAQVSNNIRQCKDKRCRSINDREFRSIKANCSL